MTPSPWIQAAANFWLVSQLKAQPSDTNEILSLGKLDKETLREHLLVDGDKAGIWGPEAADV